MYLKSWSISPCFTSHSPFISCISKLSTIIAFTFLIVLILTDVSYVVIRHTHPSFPLFSRHYSTPTSKQFPNSRPKRFSPGALPSCWFILQEFRARTATVDVMWVIDANSQPGSIGVWRQSLSWPGWCCFLFFTVATWLFPRVRLLLNGPVHPPPPLFSGTSSFAPRAEKEIVRQELTRFSAKHSANVLHVCAWSLPFLPPPVTATGHTASFLKCFPRTDFTTLLLYRHLHPHQRNKQKNQPVLPWTFSWSIMGKPINWHLKFHPYLIQMIWRRDFRVDAGLSEDVCWGGINESGGAVAERYGLNVCSFPTPDLCVQMLTTRWWY